MGKNVVRIVLGLAVLLVLLSHATRLAPIPVLAYQDAFFYDFRVRATVPGGLDERIVIVDIDEKSLSEIGRWPWNRDRMAQLVKRLFDDYGARVVGFDVVFAEPDDSSGLRVLERLGQRQLRDDAAYQGALAALRPSLDYDGLFANSLKGRPVVLGYYFSNHSTASVGGALPPPALPAGTFAGRQQPLTEWTGYGANLAVFQKAAASAGHILPMLDFDGVSRRVPLVVDYQGAYYEALSLAIVRTLLGGAQLNPGFVDEGGAEYGGLEWLDIVTGRGTLTIPVDEHAAALIPFRGEQGSFRYISAKDVLTGTADRHALTGKIVLVGTSAPGLLDLRATPVGSAYPGVEVHANMIAGVLDGAVKVRPRYVMAVELVMLLVVGGLLVFLLPRLSPLHGTLLTVGVLGAFVAVVMVAWQSGLVLPVAATLWLIAILYVLNVAWGFFVEAKTKRLFTELFGQYVPPELVDEMARDPARYTMDGRKEELTVLFSDVRGFTTISEGLDPRELTRLMNEYLTAMTEVIRRHRGTVDKYIGDAIMAFWGAPVADAEHARHALLAALEMQGAVRTLDESFRQRGWPSLHIGIGLNSGLMTVGDMGSTVRKAYTVMGDAVNLASRLEGVTKIYGVGIIVGDATRAALPDFTFRELDRVRVKGKAEPVAIHEPLGVTSELDGALQAELKLWQQALRAYRTQDWDQADVALLNLERLASGSTLYGLYRDRVAYLRQHPPGEDWDGVTTFDTK